MIRIAITGGIGSGKSYVSRLLEERGIPVYNADNEAKRLTASHEGIRSGLRMLVGDAVYQGDTLNKPLLASYLFANAENASRVNAIIHPRVKEDFIRWTAEQEAEVVGLESAILYEAGFQDTVDAVVMVFAPETLRIRRAMQRDNASEAQVKARIAAQLDDAEKARRADFVIVNDGTEALLPQLDNLIERLKTSKIIC